MLRFLLLRYLPRRLVPLLVLWQVVQLVRRLRAGRPLFGDAPYDDRPLFGARSSYAEDDRIIEGRATPVPPRAVEPPR